MRVSKYWKIKSDLQKLCVCERLIIGSESASAIGRLMKSSTLLDIAWSGHQFMIVEFNREVLTSMDGIHWTNHRPTGTTFLNDVVWANGRYVAVGNLDFVLGGYIATSADVAGDFNADYMSEMLFHQTSTGRNFMVLVNGRGVLSQGFVRRLAQSWMVINTQ